MAQHEYVQDELEWETFKDVTDTKVSDNGEEKSNAVSKSEYDIVDPTINVNKTFMYPKHSLFSFTFIKNKTIRLTIMRYL